MWKTHGFPRSKNPPSHVLLVADPGGVSAAWRQSDWCWLQLIIKYNFVDMLYKIWIYSSTRSVIYIYILCHIMSSYGYFILIQRSAPRPQLLLCLTVCHRGRGLQLHLALPCHRSLAEIFVDQQNEYEKTWKYGWTLVVFNTSWYKFCTQQISDPS